MVNSGSKTAKKTYISKKIKDNDIQISLKDINDDYSWCDYGNFKVIIMKKNGYINATKLIHQSSKNKKLNDWTRGKLNQELIDEFSLLLDIPANHLIIPITTSSKNLTEIRGTYVHPLLITHIAHWISPKFAVKVGIWIEEWKNYSNENFIEYYNCLSKLEPSLNLNKEKTIQKELKKKLHGKTEVPTEMGYIDLLTNKDLIEIKSYDDWKCGLGQLIVYSIGYSNKQKCMYLFDVNDQKINHIQKACDLNDIKLIIYD